MSIAVWRRRWPWATRLKRATVRICSRRRRRRMMRRYRNHWHGGWLGQKVVLGSWSWYNEIWYEEGRNSEKSEDYERVPYYLRSSMGQITMFNLKKDVQLPMSFLLAICRGRHKKACTLLLQLAVRLKFQGFYVVTRCAWLSIPTCFSQQQKHLFIFLNYKIIFEFDGL